MAKGDTDKGEEVVAVAIDKDKGSQYALKWTVEHLLSKGQALTLVHVNHQSPVPSPRSKDVNDEAARIYKQQLENQTKQLFLPCRCFCTRKNIKCNEVILEDTDIAKALINYITANTVETMVFGASSRSGFVRKFKTIDIPSLVLRGAPDFCTLYVISKGKISSLRSAIRPPPAKTTRRPQMQNQDHAASDFIRRKQFRERRGYAPLSQNDDVIKSPFRRNNRASMSKAYESFMPDTDISFVSDARPSLDQMCPSLYEDLDSEWTPRLSIGLESDFGSHGTPSLGKKASQIISLQSDNPSSSQENETLWGPDEVEAEMRRLRLELKQTMEMYNTACREALTAKQKARELHLWKLEEERRLEEARLAEEIALAEAEKEKAKCKAALEVADAAKKIAALEAQKRVDAEMKALQGGENASFGFKHVKMSYRRYTIEEIEAATDCFAESRKIGEGGYGPVFRCELDHTPVAVKVLRPDAAHGRSQFQQEVEVLSCIRHPNMVLLLGACPEYGCLVYEYLANGSLDDRLFRRGNTPVLSWNQRFRIAAEIGTGLLFLHQTKPEPLVHRDLKPANILLDRNFVSKIGDVGLARLVPPAVADDVTQYRLTSTAGTFCYIDPEYQQTGMLGIKSDIYSLGVMLLQMITAKPPMGLTHHVDQAIETGTLDQMLDPAVPDWPAEETLKFAKLSLQCAEMRRKDRPDLGSIILPELNRLRTFAEDNMPGTMTCRSEGSSPVQLSPPITQDVISDSRPPESGCDC